MIRVRKSDERGHFNHGWLDTYHTFSFDEYYDPAFMHYRHLRVLNEDRVAPGSGFPKHGHRDMEIVTVILEGALQHRDSLGNGAVIRPGEVQRMTAGTGVQHSEFNASETEPVHLLQIWILPKVKDLPPSYEQKLFPSREREARWKLVASGDSRDGSLLIHQNAEIYLATIEAGKTLTHTLNKAGHAWFQLARGQVKLNGVLLSTGDGAAIENESELTCQALGRSEALLFLLF